MNVVIQTKEHSVQQREKTSAHICMHVRGSARTDERVLREAKALEQQGIAVTIVDMEQERTRPTEELVNNIRLRHTFPPIRPFLPRLKLWRIVDRVYSHLWNTGRLLNVKADAYHAHDWTALPACYIASRWHRKPLIFDAHELPLSELDEAHWTQWRPLFSVLLAKIMPHCAGIITVSPPIAGEIRRYYTPSCPVTLVRNMHRYTQVPHSNRIRELLGLSSQVRIALYQGNMQPNRGLDRIVRVASFLDPDIVIVLMGRAYGDTLVQLESLIEQEHVADRVKIIPPVAHTDLLNWTTSADIGLILYRPEQSLNVQWCLPNKLFEYIMAGLPILATQLDAVSELLHQYHTGHIVPSLAPEAIADAINRMLANKEALATMKHNALEAAQSDLCWETEQQQLIALYRKILDKRLSVCVPITGFPISGGMHGVLAGVAQVMRDRWTLTYLTQHRGPESEEFNIEQFGHKWSHPWQFPSVWLYSFAGFWKLMKLLRRDSSIQLLLPQDGVFTGAFTALVGKMLGRRVVCMDHGSVTLLNSAAYRKERQDALKQYIWPRRVFASLRLACYWHSLRLLARIATRYADHFLIAGDEVAEVYQRQLSVRQERITRYAYTIDVTRFTPPDRETRNNVRATYGYSPETVLITLINRLAPEKGLFQAVEGIETALATLNAEMRQRVKILIAGNGPLRTALEDEIRRRGLESTCSLYGNANSDEVRGLLAITDIFLYSGTRGTNYSMAVLEAMAAGCAVIASTSPQSNATLLAEERGIAVTPGSSSEIADAILHLCNNPGLIATMGQAARAYVAHHHSAAALQQALLKASSSAR